MDFTDFFSKNSINLSNSDKKICTFLSQQPNHISSLTLQKIAGGTGTSIASIQRFCKKLGYSGFQEFKFAFKNYLLQNQSSTSSKENTYLTQYAKLLPQIVRSNQSQIDKLVSIIKNTNPQIFSFGIFYSSIPAQFLNMALIDNGYNCQYANNYVSGSHLLNIYSPKDVIVFFSISADNKVEFNQHFKDEFSKYKNTFLITFNPNSTIKDNFKNTIVIPGRELILNSFIDTQSISCLLVEDIINKLNQKA